MTVYRKDRTRSLEPVATIPTRETLSRYDPAPGREGISKDYLVALIAAWLHDFGFRRGSELPPAWETMSALGLADRLKDGWLKRRVRLACLPVRGDELPDELRDRVEPGGRLHPIGPVAVSPADHA
jgi:hypothetical protein